jgi:asparagine synthase (glutamine-hydrolysing)
MCGIAGIVDLGGGPFVAQDVRRMCNVMRHRGPDDEGLYLKGCAGLGMRRLSIIDLETGRQPIHNEDGTVWVVLNGEIYNFRELRRDLESRGHVFYTLTDTETIVHLYEEYGDGCVDHLRGMFAFALWDEKLRRLLLVRDRLGVKPLYYAEVASRLVFASELKALLKLPYVEPEINWPAASHLFTFLTTPASESIVQGVRKLPPAHLLVATPGSKTQLFPYWDLRFEAARGRSAPDLAEELRSRLDESVRLRLVSDVPLGAFLSGGLDSSAVVASMARQQTGPVKTFTIGFKDRASDESAHARRVARRFRTEHHELVLEPEVTDVVEDIAWHLDEPFGDSSAIPTFMVSQLAAQHVKVVLSGDGGDELFAGYDKYGVEARRRIFPLPSAARRIAGMIAGRLPPGARGRNFLRNLALDGPRRYLDESTLFRRDAKERLFLPEVLERMGDADPSSEELGILTRGADGHWLSAVRYLDLKAYLPLDILTKVDRMSMAHSLEAREPLLDHPLVEFAATIPPGMLLRGSTTKWLFKEAMRGILPDDIIDRRKHGFAVPLGSWFRGRLGGFVRDLLLTKRCRDRGFFNPAAIEDLVQRHEQGRQLDLHLWTLLSFELWCRAFVDARSYRLAEVSCASL